MFFNLATLKAPEEAAEGETTKNGIRVVSESWETTGTPENIVGKVFRHTLHRI